MDVELEKVNDSLSKVTKEKLSLEGRLNEVSNSLQTEEDKASRLGKLKTKLEASLQDAQEEIEKEKKAVSDLDKAKRKLEGDLKVKKLLSKLKITVHVLSLPFLSSSPFLFISLSLSLSQSMTANCDDLNSSKTELEKVISS